MSAVKRNLLIFLCMICSALVVFMLYAIVPEPNRVKNGFIRANLKHKVSIIKSMAIEHDGYYIAGLSKTKIYLGNYNAQLHLLILDYKLRDTQQITLRLDTIPKTRLLKLVVDSPHVFLYEGVGPTLYKSNLPNYSLNTYFGKTASFIAGIPLNEHSMIVRAYDGINKKTDLYKVSNDSSGVVRFTKNILEKQVDGILCCTGSFNFNRDAGKIVYVYRYRNQFICMDTGLNVLYKAETIDTNTVAKISVSDTDTESTLDAASLTINNISCISDSLIFVSSNLMGDNESIVEYNKSNSIDVYSLRDGKYLYSFGLPKYQENSIKDIDVFEDKLVAIYKNRIIIYRLLNKNVY
ncbi:hypothetical protein AAHN97_16095 [Chitinophaga niabensis]|uniref:hypothetical protein n=1 Tax=Chitinophaga niabensis TaxID=536979 RepID=UPI0031BB3DE2